MDQEKKDSLEADESLESVDAGTETAPASGKEIDANKADDKDKKDGKKDGKSDEKKGNLFQRLISHVNIYFLLFIFIMLLAAIIIFLAMRINKKTDTSNNPVSSQDLSQDTLDKLKESENNIGDPKQTLNIESNAVFSGKVLVRDSLDVAGTIKVGGNLSLPGITVAGTSTFDEVQMNTMQVAEDAQILGTLSVQKGLTVSGGGTFSGPISAPQITVETFQLANDLIITRHIDAGGSTPTISAGGGIGGGGTVSVSGADTAGTVTINTGGGTSAGLLATVTFARAFNETPHVVITPVGSAAAQTGYYITRTRNGFTVNANNTPPVGASISFDYVAID